MLYIGRSSLASEFGVSSVAGDFSLAGVSSAGGDFSVAGNFNAAAWCF